MATKKNVKPATTNDVKETTMPTITMPENFDKMKLADRVALHNAWKAIIDAADVEPAPIDVKHACPGKGLDNLSKNKDEVAYLPTVAAYFGWEDDEFCSVAQAKDCRGTLKEGAQGWPILWVPSVTKSGPNAGKTAVYCNFVFPKSAFVWDNDKPEIDEHAIAVKELDSLIKSTNRSIAAIKAKAKELGIKVDAKRVTVVKPAEPKPKDDDKLDLSKLSPELIAVIKAALAA